MYTAPPFLHGGRNYLARMAADVDAIGHSDNLDALLQQSATAAHLPIDPLRLWAAQHAVRLEAEVSCFEAR